MLYLPLSLEKTERLVATRNPQIFYPLLSFHELSVIAIATEYSQGLPRPPQNLSIYALIEKTFCLVLEELKAANFITIANAFADAHQADAIQSGIDKLKQLPELTFMSEQQVGEKAYFNHLGDWIGLTFSAEDALSESVVIQPLTLDDTNPANYSVKMAPSQARIFTEAIADLRSIDGEHTHIQGLAGVGKTWMLAKLALSVDCEKTLFLTETAAQRRSLQNSLPSNTPVDTIGYFAFKTIKNLGKDIQHSLVLGNRYQKQYYNKVAIDLGYHSLGKLSAQQVLRVVNKTIDNFCSSTDDNLLASHLPQQDRQRRPLSFSLSDSEQLIILALAEQFWQLTLVPEKGMVLPIWDMHLIKFMALTELPIDPVYRQIIVDESHNLKPVVLQLLDRLDRPLIMLGDRYQAVRSFSKQVASLTTTHQRVMSDCYRTGDKGVALTNKIILKHNQPPEQEGKGNRYRKTVVDTYNAFVLPDKPHALLAQDIWALFVVIRQLIRKNVPFHVDKTTRYAIAEIISTAIKFRQSEIRPESTFLTYYPSWHVFVDSTNDPYIDEIERFLAHGYNQDDLDNDLKLSSAEYSPAHYFVARMEDARNIEMESVMLLEEKRFNVDKGLNNRQKNLLYIALSRGISRLLLPRKYREWIEDSVS